jgi:hypothetical protein
MSLGYIRGGIPAHVNRTTAIATVENWQWEGGIANHLWFKNTGAGPIVLSFTNADSTADIGVTLAAGAIWEGPTEIAAFYTKSAAAQTFEAVVFRRRG